MGRASLVLDGLNESIWVRGQQGSNDAFKGTVLEKLHYTTGTTVVTEGLIDFDGDFFLSSTTRYDLGPLSLLWNITISNEGISAHVEGTAKWSADIDYGGGSVGGTAKATLAADLGIEVDDNGDLHLSGSVSASGKLTARIAGQSTDLFSGSIGASVRSKGLRFRFPRGVGELDLDLL
jgi:hypothetical protein